MLLPHKEGPMIKFLAPPGGGSHHCRRQIITKTPKITDNKNPRGSELASREFFRVSGKQERKEQLVTGVTGARLRLQICFLACGLNKDWLSFRWCLETRHTMGIQRRFQRGGAATAHTFIGQVLRTHILRICPSGCGRRWCCTRRAV